MNASLSTLVDNLFELKSCYCEKKSFDSINLTHKIIKNEAYAIPSCKTCKWQKSIILSDLIKKLPSTYMLCNNNVKKFLLLLRKGVYP